MNTCHTIARCQKYGMNYNSFLCFGEDTEKNIVLRELPDKKLWDIPDRIKDKTAFVERINEVLREYRPDYWQAGQERKAARPAVPAPTQGYNSVTALSYALLL